MKKHSPHTYFVKTDFEFIWTIPYPMNKQSITNEYITQHIDAIIKQGRRKNAGQDIWKYRLKKTHEKITDVQMKKKEQINTRINKHIQSMIKFLQVLSHYSSDGGQNTQEVYYRKLNIVDQSYTALRSWLSRENENDIKFVSQADDIVLKQFQGIHVCSLMTTYIQRFISQFPAFFHYLYVNTIFTPVYHGKYATEILSKKMVKCCRRISEFMLSQTQPEFCKALETTINQYNECQRLGKTFIPPFLQYASRQTIYEIAIQRIKNEFEKYERNEDKLHYCPVSLKQRQKWRKRTNNTKKI